MTVVAVRQEDECGRHRFQVELHGRDTLSRDASCTIL